MRPTGGRAHSCKLGHLAIGSSRIADNCNRTGCELRVPCYELRVELASRVELTHNPQPGTRNSHPVLLLFLSVLREL